MNDATLSVVIPAHNGERFLHAAISSAVRQSRQADEIIVVDDASKDRTAEIAKSAEFGGRVKYYFNEEASGFVNAWNRAVLKATGDFVSILHQDDVLHPEYLEHMENAVRRYPEARHLYAACVYIDENDSITGMPPEPHSPDPVLYSGKQYAHNYLSGVISNRHIHRCPGVLTSRKLLLEECTYRKEAGHIADDDFFLRVGAFTDVVGISQPLASFRQHKGSVTGRLDLLSLKLAEAYLFQVRYYNDGGTILGPEDTIKINRQAVRFINLLLFQGVLHERNDWAGRALELRDEFESMEPGFLERSTPKWSRLLWHLMTGQGRSRPAATLYVKVLHGIIQIRDFGLFRLKRM